MREIKFRFWDLETKVMMGPIDLRPPKGIMEFDGYPIYYVKGKKADWVFLQFTGLLDKNGKEIYEGDIVKIAFHSSEIADGGQGMVEYTHEVSFYNGSFSFERVEDCEVIGNIYQNPELIK